MAPCRPGTARPGATAPRRGPAGADRPRTSARRPRHGPATPHPAECAITRVAARSSAKRRSSTGARWARVSSRAITGSAPRRRHSGPRSPRSAHRTSSRQSPRGSRSAPRAVKWPGPVLRTARASGPIDFVGRDGGQVQPLDPVVLSPGTRIEQVDVDLVAAHPRRVDRQLHPGRSEVAGGREGPLGGARRRRVAHQRSGHRRSPRPSAPARLAAPAGGCARHPRRLALLGDAPEAAAATRRRLWAPRPTSATKQDGLDQNRAAVRLIGEVGERLEVEDRLHDAGGHEEPRPRASAMPEKRRAASRRATVSGQPHRGAEWPPGERRGAGRCRRPTHSSPRRERCRVGTSSSDGSWRPGVAGERGRDHEPRRRERARHHRRHAAHGRPPGPRSRRATRTPPAAAPTLRRSGCRARPGARRSRAPPKQLVPAAVAPWSTRPAAHARAPARPRPRTGCGSSNRTRPMPRATPGSRPPRRPEHAPRRER